MIQTSMKGKSIFYSLAIWRPSPSWQHLLLRLSTHHLSAAPSYPSHQVAACGCPCGSSNRQRNSSTVYYPGHSQQLLGLEIQPCRSWVYLWNRGAPATRPLRQSASMPAWSWTDLSNMQPFSFGFLVLPVEWNHLKTIPLPW